MRAMLAGMERRLTTRRVLVRVAILASGVWMGTG
jgi:hypothetical protein